MRPPMPRCGKTWTRHRKCACGISREPSIARRRILQAQFSSPTQDGEAGTAMLDLAVLVAALLLPNDAVTRVRH